jgi:glyoxylase-like metal-dependent hydrolase (beta-lactamase superfamily II)
MCCSCCAGAAPAFTNSPKVGRPGPAFFRIEIGDIEHSMIYDGEAQRPLTEGYVKNASLKEVQAAFASSLRSVTATETLSSFIAVNSGDKVVRIDAGSGGANLPDVTSSANNLAAAGIDPAAVDRAILTHFHGNHNFGLTDDDMKPRFPKADILVPDTEYRFLAG